MRTGPLVAAAVTAALITAGATSAATAATKAPTAAQTSFNYQGDAYGTRVNVGNLVKSGPSALVVLGCTTKAGIHRTNTAVGVNLSPALTTGTIDTTADTFASPVEARTSATVQNANLLSGLIRATVLRSVSATTHDSTGFHTSAAGTTFTSLVVGGNAIGVNVSPNTRINLAGLGYVIVNEQMARTSATSASLTVNAVHVVVTTVNTLNLAVGTNIIVAHATSGLAGPIHGTLDGQAYGSSVKLGSVVRSGPSFPIYMPCLGTNGVLRVHSGAGVNVPGVLVSGTIRNTAQGTVGTTSAVGEMTSTVESANVLSSLVQATVVKADAHAAKNSGAFSFSDSGSSFASLSVNGFPLINANVAANTQLNIAGVGTLYLHRVIRTANSIEIRMIELVVTQNLPGLPAGSDIRVAVAEASAH